jgi:hypothetical protein
MLRKANFFKWRTTTLTDTGVYDSNIYSTSINCWFCLEFCLTPASFPPVNITKVELSLLKSLGQFLSKWIDYYPISVSWQSNKTHLHCDFVYEDHLWKLARVMSNEKWCWHVILCDNRWCPNNKSWMYMCWGAHVWSSNPTLRNLVSNIHKFMYHTHSYLSILVCLDLT